MTTSQEIRQRILALDTTDQNLAPELEEYKVLKNNNLMPAVLGLCILILSIATFGAILLKRHPSEVLPPNHNVTSRTDVETIFEKVDQKINQIDKRVDVLSNRIWLLGIAHNENINLIAKHEWERFGVNSNYIVFDEKWNLSRMPETMPLSDEMKEGLSKNIK